MADCMTFPDTVEEFMEQYKIVDTEHVYTNGTEFVPIYRMKQWFEHLPPVQPKKGHWITYHYISENWSECECDQCHKYAKVAYNFCPNCGADMRD